MFRWFKTRRALLKELAEYQTAFNALAASFERHRVATKKTADLQQQTIARLDLAVEQMRISRELAAEVRGGTTSPPAPRYNPNFTRLRNRPLPADLAEAIDEETAMKRRLDGLGDPA